MNSLVTTKSPGIPGSDAGADDPSGEHTAWPGERRSTDIKFVLISSDGTDDTPDVRQISKYLEPTSTEAHCDAILERFLGDCTLFALPVVNAENVPVALVDRKEFVEFFSRIYTWEIFGKLPILKLIGHPDYKTTEPIVVEDGCGVAEVARLILSRGMQHMVTGFIVTSEGAYVGIASGHDLLRLITQRCEDELRRFNAELEARVAARTAELEAANKQLESFSYTIAHDLRGPVRTINGFAEMVLAETRALCPPRSVAHLGRIISSSRHMAQLIDDILGLSRLSRQEMRMQSFDLADTATEVVRLLVEANPSRRVRFNVQPGLLVEADPGLMRVLLENVIGNAWNYTSKVADAEIRLGMERNDARPVFFVRDNGAGFDMRYAHKLFAPFQRLHHASEFEGTGIGLATVKKVIDRHYGKVWIESAPGRGTTLRFTLGVLK